MSIEINVGDSVEVVDIGEHYWGYSDWADEHRFKFSCLTLGLLKELEYKVIAKGLHGDVGLGMLYGIQDASGTNFIIGEKGIKLVQKKFNGQDADGNLVYFSEADLKPFMRVKTLNGQVWAVVKDAQGCGELVLVTKGGWVPFRIDYKDNHDYDAVEVRDAPAYNNQLLTLDISGALLWKRIEESPETVALKARAKHLEEALAGIQKEIKKLENAGVSLV